MTTSSQDANPFDETVRPDQVETTLPRQDDGGLSKFIPTPSNGERTHEQTADSKDSRPYRARRAAPTIPGYEIVGELGRGGMGVVYRATNRKLERNVALKMILAGDHASPESLARFRSESLAIAKVQHRNVVQIFHVDEHEGWPFFEMEFVPGGNLAVRLLGEPFPHREASLIIGQLASGTAEAHRHRIVHRDLKPGNILLDQDGTPKIADFGLAKILGSDSGTTRTESIMGSPTYMAPEQADGKARDVGPTADVYALGAILYELLVGRPPFRGATVLETLDQVKHTDPVPPSRLVPTVPRDLETICLTCLRKEPASRYPTATALAEDLRRFAAGESILARRTGVARRLWLWARRNPNVAVLAAVAVGLLVVLAVGSTIAAARLRHERSLVERAEGLRKVDLARSLMTALPDSVPFIVESLTVARGQAISLLRPECDDPGASEDRKIRASAVLTMLGEDRSPFLIERIEKIAGAEASNIHLALAAAPRSSCVAMLRASFDRAKSKELRARLATTLLDLGDDRAALSMLTVAPDPAERIAFIRSFPAWHGDLAAIPGLLRRGTPDLRSGLIVALGLSDPDRLSDTWPPILEAVTELYRVAPDGGTHSAAGWALRVWHAEVPTIAASGPIEGAGWFINRHGLAMIEMPPGLLTIDEPWRGAERRRLAMTRPSYLSDSEISAKTYRQFLEDPTSERPDAKFVLERDRPLSDDHPISSVSWNDAVLFCNWLSRAEGRTECYIRDDVGPKGWQCRYDLDGYRLPTAAEWEYACRAGSQKLFATGERPESLALFANSMADSTVRIRSKAPNAFGLFDMNGNLWEWIGDASYPDESPSATMWIDPVDTRISGSLRALCGGAFDSGSNDFRLNNRIWPDADHRSYSFGFRVAVSGREDGRASRVVESIETLASGLAAEPKTVGQAGSIRAKLGIWYAGRSESRRAKALFATAADDFSGAVRFDPSIPKTHYDHALMLALKGDREACRISCERMLEMVSRRGGPAAAMNAAHASSFLPSTVSLTGPRQIAESRLARNPNTPWYRYVVGLIEYRAGHYPETVAQLNRIEGNEGWRSAMLCWPVLAMAHHRLGQKTEAERLLEKSRAFRRSQGEGGGIGGLNQLNRWWDLAEFLLLLDEAEEVLREPFLTPTVATPPPSRP